MPDPSIFDQMLASVLGMGMLQWMATLFGIAYVILAAKESPWCWPIGLVSVVMAFFVYINPNVKLYSDAILQVFYAGMSVYGWWAWTRNGTENKVEDNPVTIGMWPWQNHLIALGGGVVLAGLLGLMWSQLGAALPYIDAMTSAFSVIATFMVTRKILENWLYWIVIDTVCIFVYIHRELYLFAILFLVYAIVAAVGYYEWRRAYQDSLVHDL